MKYHDPRHTRHQDIDTSEVGFVRVKSAHPPEETRLSAATKSARRRGVIEARPAAVWAGCSVALATFRTDARWRREGDFSLASPGRL